MSVIIRHELPEEYRETEEIIRDAFYNLYFPGCEEHYLAHKMRTHKDYLPSLSFVLEKDGELIGSIFYSKSHILGEDGGKTETVTFGPVCIAPNYHRQGFGRQLIEHSIKAAKSEGHRAIIIAGYPFHYKPYGFTGTKNYNISMPDGKFYTGIMALPLYDGALDNVSGTIVFTDVFVLDKAETEAFDAQFAPKEKKVLPCQAQFEKAVQEQDV